MASFFTLQFENKRNTIITSFVNKPSARGELSKKTKQRKANVFVAASRDSRFEKCPTPQVLACMRQRSISLQYTVCVHPTCTSAREALLSKSVRQCVNHETIGDV